MKKVWIMLLLLATCVGIAPSCHALPFRDVTSEVQCTECGGAKYIENSRGDLFICPKCEGKGKTTEIHPIPFILCALFVLFAIPYWFGKK